MEWFNGGLFDDDTALPLGKTDIEITLKAAALDWSEIDPSILGTLFERGLDPGKRSQLGAHYTDRAKIMRIIEPVIIRPWLAEWETAKANIAASLERADKAKSIAAGTRLRGQAERLLRTFLDRLTAFTVLDPACGSGNFLYLALHALKDLEHRCSWKPRCWAFNALSLRSVLPTSKELKINAYAAELAARVGLDRRNPVDATQRILRIPRSDPQATQYHRMSRRDLDAGGRGAGMAGSGRADRQPTVPW